MTRRGCTVVCAVALILLFAVGVWINFALSYERERAVSPDGEWVATSFIDGTPLSAENERVHVWRWWQPRFRWLGCQVLEAKNEARIRLIWENPHRLRVQHGFRPHELKGVSNRCGAVQVFIEREFAPYS